MKFLIWIMLLAASCSQGGSQNENLKYCKNACQQAFKVDLTVCSDELAQCYDKKESDCHDKYKICCADVRSENLICKSNCKNGYCANNCKKQHKVDLKECAEGKQDDYLDCKDIADDKNYQCLEECAFK